MGKAVLYVRVGTEEQLVNDRAEKQVVVDGLNSVSNEKMGQGRCIDPEGFVQPEQMKVVNYGASQQVYGY